MKDYEINSKTLAIMPLGKDKSVVYENHDCYIIEKKVNKIMDSSCQFYGSSYEGRLKGTLSLTGISYKAPIIIAEDKNIIFFPTSSPRLKDCGWISSNNIKKIYYKEDKCLIEFTNNELLEVESSYNIINNQILRASKLETSLIRRKNN